MKIMRKGGIVGSDYKEKLRGGKFSKAKIGFFLHLLSQRSPLEKSKDHSCHMQTNVMLPTVVV